MQACQRSLEVKGVGLEVALEVAHEHLVFVLVKVVEDLLVDCCKHSCSDYSPVEPGALAAAEGGLSPVKGWWSPSCSWVLDVAQEHDTQRSMPGSR